MSQKMGELFCTARFLGGYSCFQPKKEIALSAYDSPRPNVKRGAGLARCAWLAVIAAMLLVLSAVQLVPTGESSGTTIRENPPATLTRIIDEAAGAVCWTNRAGLSCLPVEDTLLKGGQ